MLAARKLQKFNVFSSYNLKFDWNATLPLLGFHLKMLFSTENSVRFIFKATQLKSDVVLGKWDGIFFFYSFFNVDKNIQII